VGGDLAFMAAQGDNVEHALHALAADLHGALDALARVDAPVIAAVNGVAAGAGMSLVCAADLAIAGASARFTMAYTRAGLSPDGGATWYLPRIVGIRRAMELALTNAQLDARAAAELGLVTRVVADDDLGAAVDELAGAIAAGATGAYGAVKRLMRSSFATTLESQLADEAATIARLAAAPEGREGVSAFLAKRTPNFRQPRGGG
jgi:2-(1,2-epoxy-1,2-dihydrophenyl)acetyl-CoA isomerase